MNIIINIIMVIGAFLFMEGVAWFNHKYVMHGFMWKIHKSHHVPPNGFFERNDLFFLIFAIPGWLLIQFGVMGGCDFRLYLGIGVTLYGMAYVLVHEVFIHQRVKWFRNTSNKYLKAVRRAHKTHHKNLGKENGECFGMLIIPRKFFKETKA